MIILGRKCETGRHAIESPARLFGRLVATELVALEFQEAILIKSGRSQISAQLRDLYKNAEENFEIQLKNHNDHRVSRIVRRNKKDSLDAFRSSISDAIDYFDENVLD